MARRSVLILVAALATAGSFAVTPGPLSASAGPPTSGSPTAHATGGWAVVAGGEGFTCGIRVDRTLWCWGLGGARLGQGDTHDKLVPTLTSADPDWTSVSLGYSHSCGVRVDHELWCWGYNLWGQLGLGDRGTGTSRYVPTRVGTDTDWASVALGYGHTCGIRLNGTLWCWGNNDHGELGVGGRHLRKTPTRVGSSHDWAQVEAGSLDSSTCATRIDGTLWCWGQNRAGQLGLGDQKAREVPTQVGTEADWAQVSAGGQFSCATRTDSTLWCWGANSAGQLGVGDTQSRNVPTQVGGSMGWTSVSTGDYHTCAVQTSGTVWCWGFNRSGQLGLGGTRSHSTPAPVGKSDWVDVRTGGEHTCAIRKADQLWCWGFNPWGQLGLGDTRDRKLPRRVAA